MVYVSVVLPFFIAFIFAFQVFPIHPVFRATTSLISLSYLFSLFPFSLLATILNITFLRVTQTVLELLTLRSSWLVYPHPWLVYPQPWIPAPSNYSYSGRGPPGASSSLFVALPGLTLPSSPHPRPRARPPILPVPMQGAHILPSSPPVSTCMIDVQSMRSCGKSDVSLVPSVVWNIHGKRPHCLARGMRP